MTQVGIAASALMAATVISGFAVPSDATSSSGERRDASGLLVISTTRDLVIPEEARDAWAAYDALTEAFPDDFGYASPNLVGSSVDVSVVTSVGANLLASVSKGQAIGGPFEGSAASDEEAKRAWALSEAATRAPGLSARAVGTSQSRRQVEEIKNRLIDWSLEPLYTNARIWSTYVERSTGKVVLIAEKLTPELSAAVVSAYGTEAVVVKLEANPNYTVGARLNDGVAFWGGARIKVPGGYQCTDGFSWRLPNSVHAMVTAGHCVPVGGSVSTPLTSMGSVSSGSYENYNLTVGTVTVPGYSGYHGDGAVIKLSSGKTSANSIYRGQYNSNWGTTVKQMWSRRAQQGDSYCTGGSFSGEICGWNVFLTQTTMQVWNDRSQSYEVVRNVARSYAKQGWCARSGDSGGSVFTLLTTGEVAAKGIHNGGSGGGSDYYGGLNDPCGEYFTDIWDIYYGLPGWLAT